MSVHHSISELTTEKIRANTFEQEIPEFYALRTVVESQGWHDNQTVFDHSLESVDSLDEMLRFEYLEPAARDRLIAYLDTTLDTCTRRELLVFATLLHDIGKTISLQTNAQGNTGSPSHGLIGCWVAEPLVARFGLSEREQKHVLGLVSDHLVPSDLIEMSINNKTPNEGITELLTAHRPESTVELLLLAYADWMGCDVREPVEAELAQRVVVVQECLGRLSGQISNP